MQTSQPFFQYTHLSEHESSEPMLAIDRFCELFPPAIARQTLWLWLSETLTAEDTQYENASHRADLLLFYNELLRLLDANYLFSLSKSSSNKEIIVMAS
jgi:hypothetical protein